MGDEKYNKVMGLKNILWEYFDDAGLQFESHSYDPETDLVTVIGITKKKGAIKY